MDEEKNKRDKHVKWDEEKLKETEQFRGTYEKIDEPKTPYRANNSDVLILQCRKRNQMKWSKKEKHRRK